MEGSALLKRFSTSAELWKEVHLIYETKERIGFGRDGTYIIRAMLKESARSVALKCIPTLSRTSKEYENEALILLSLYYSEPRSPYIMACYHAYSCPTELVLVCEYCPTDLLEYVNSGAISPEESKKIFKSLLTALLYLHERGLAHRDIKLENILLRETNNGREVRLADFGFASSYKKGERFYRSCGTLDYAPAELLVPISAVNYDPEKADVYALGVVLYALCHGLLPYSSGDDEENVAQIREGKPFISASLSEENEALLRAMLETKPEKRLTLSQVREHPWLQ